MTSRPGHVADGSGRWVE